MKYDYDLIIGGAGLAGNCLALALKNSGIKSAVIEAKSKAELNNAAAGDRALALSLGTVIMLNDLGIWQGIADQATPIETIHVSDKGHFGKTRLSAQKQQVPALGYVITARIIEQHVANLVAQTEIQQFYTSNINGLISGRDSINVSVKQANKYINFTARLLVGADGGQSTIRSLLKIKQQQTDYHQSAIVTTVKGTLAHKNTAYERFTNSGPLALLPTINNQAALIWTRTNAQANELINLSKTEFIQQLQQCFGYRLGHLSITAPRHAFPLKLIRAEKMFAGRAVIIGNAVHQLHPVAGQGFNLGLRDVAQLASLLSLQQRRQADIGAQTCLEQYTKMRQQDHTKIINFTDNLIKLFSNTNPMFALARNLGLTTLDHIYPAKNILTRHAMGLAESHMPMDFLQK